MSDALPILLLIWAFGRSQFAPLLPVHKKPKAPKWPSPKSPPPIPAFEAKHGTAEPTGPSTPLAQLHKAPPQIERPKTVLEQAQSAAKKKGFKAILDVKNARYRSLLPRDHAMSTALVSNLQKIVNTHGGKLVEDGLYGPRTASAWTALAKRKGLTPTISRQGPKIAKVVTQTYEQLQVPPIP